MHPVENLETFVAKCFAHPPPTAMLPKMWTRSFNSCPVQTGKLWSNGKIIQTHHVKELVVIFDNEGELPLEVVEDKELHCLSCGNPTCTVCLKHPKVLPVVPLCLPPDARNLFADFLDEESFFTSLGDVVCNCPFCHWSTHCATNFLTLSHVVCDGIGVCFDWCCLCACQCSRMQCSSDSLNIGTFPITKPSFFVKKKSFADA